MINREYEKMLGNKDEIFEIFAFANKRRAEVGDENVYDFSLGNPSVAPPKAVDDAVREILAETDPVALHGYSPQGGIASVRAKVAEDLNTRFGSEFAADNIFMTCGANSAIRHAAGAVTNPGDKVLTFAPCFSEYEMYIGGAGCELTVVPPDTKSFQIDMDAAEALFDERVTAVLVNSPNNPSGIVYTEDTIRQLAGLMTRKAEEYGHPIYLISDEPYRELVFSDCKAPFIANYYDNSIVCYSFSKSLSMPGERIGYAAVNPKAEDAAKIMELFILISRRTGHNGAPVLWQRVLEKVLPCTSDLSVYEKNANILYNALCDYGYDCVKPGGSFYMLPAIPGGDKELFMKTAFDNDIMVVPGDGFGCPGHFRIAYCVPTERVERSLDGFASIIRSLKG